MTTSISTIPRTVDRLIQLSTLVRTFGDIRRATMRDGRYETDGEHTLHLQFLAVSYAAEHHPYLDIGKVSLFALVHDFVEVYADDTPTLTATANALVVKEQRESDALHRLEFELGDSWPTFILLLKEYESLQTPEARFIRTFDKCDPGFSHLYDNGSALRVLGIENRMDYTTANEAVKQRMLSYSYEFPDVMAIREELQGRIAETAYPTV